MGRPMLLLAACLGAARGQSFSDDCQEGADGRPGAASRRGAEPEPGAAALLQVRTEPWSAGRTSIQGGVVRRCSGELKDERVSGSIFVLRGATCVLHNAVIEGSVWSEGHLVVQGASHILSSAFHSGGALSVLGGSTISGDVVLWGTKSKTVFDDFKLSGFLETHNPDGFVLMRNGVVGGARIRGQIPDIRSVDPTAEGGGRFPDYDDGFSMGGAAVEKRDLRRSSLRCPSNSVVEVENVTFSEPVVFEEDCVSIANSRFQSDLKVSHGGHGYTRVTDTIVQESLVCEQRRGDAFVGNVSVGDFLEYLTIRGDVKFADVVVGRSMAVRRVDGGSVFLRNITTTRNSRVSSVAGSVSASGINALEDLSVRIISGDVRVDTSRSGTLEYEKIDGDVSVSNSLVGRLEARSLWGNLWVSSVSITKIREPGPFVEFVFGSVVIQDCIFQADERASDPVLAITSCSGVQMLSNSVVGARDVDVRLSQNPGKVSLIKNDLRQISVESSRGVTFRSNTIRGSATFEGNAKGTVIVGNRFGGLACVGNTPAPKVRRNLVLGRAEGQCAKGPSNSLHSQNHGRGVRCSDELKDERVSGSIFVLWGATCVLHNTVVEGSVWSEGNLVVQGASHILGSVVLSGTESTTVLDNFMVSGYLEIHNPDGVLKMQNGMVAGTVSGGQLASRGTAPAYPGLRPIPLGDVERQVERRHELWAATRISRRQRPGQFQGYNDGGLSTGNGAAEKGDSGTSGLRCPSNSVVEVENVTFSEPVVFEEDCVSIASSRFQAGVKVSHGGRGYTRVADTVVQGSLRCEQRRGDAFVGNVSVGGLSFRTIRGGVKLADVIGRGMQVTDVDGSVFMRNITITGLPQVTSVTGSVFASSVNAPRRAFLMNTIFGDVRVSALDSTGVFVAGLLLNTIHGDVSVSNSVVARMRYENLFGSLRVHSVSTTRIREPRFGPFVEFVFGTVVIQDCIFQADERASDPEFSVTSCGGVRMLSNSVVGERDVDVRLSQNPGKVTLIKNDLRQISVGSSRGVTFRSNTVRGSAAFEGNAKGTVIVGNRFDGLACAGNTPAPKARMNLVLGRAEGQCAKAL